MLTGLRERKDIEKAIRAGVDDYIVKPIDPMILSQKVAELFLKKPPMQPREIEFSETNKSAQAVCGVPVHIHSLNELGLVLRSRVEIPDGFAVELTTDLFKKMQLPVPKMKVLQCRKLVEYQYEVRIGFLGINERFTQKLRAWINSQQGTKVA
jgi:CheY-like chemotaxis protein